MLTPIHSLWIALICPLNNCAQVHRKPFYRHGQIDKEYSTTDTQLSVLDQPVLCQESRWLYTGNFSNADNVGLDFFNMVISQAGADVNSNTACKDSPLHLASFCCSTQDVKNGLGVITSLFEAGTVQLITVMYVTQMRPEYKQALYSSLSYIRFKVV